MVYMKMHHCSSGRDLVLPGSAVWIPSDLNDGSRKEMDGDHPTVRICVIDDEEFTCLTLRDALCEWNMEAEGFTNPLLALERLCESRYDLVLLDIHMPEINGIDLIPRIKGCCQDVKVLIMTGYADKDLAIRAMQAGAFDLLEKPLRLGLLKHALARAIEAQQKERDVIRLVADLQKSQSELQASKERLERLNVQLRETNRALTIFAKNIDRERDEVERGIALKLKSLILPTLGRLQKDPSIGSSYRGDLEVLMAQIEGLLSGFSTDARMAAVLSFTEMRIASLIRSGFTTEDIATQLHISVNTVRTHRKNIRKKLKINNGQYSLRNYLNIKPSLA